MFEAGGLIGFARRTGRIWLSGLLLVMMPAAGGLAAQQGVPAPAPATTAAPAAPDTSSRSAKIHQLLTLLAEEWLDEQGAGRRPAAAKTEPDATVSIVGYLNHSAETIHTQLVGLASEIPKLPDDLAAAAGRFVEIRRERGWTIFINLGLFIAFGFGAQWLFQTAVRRLHHRVSEHPMATVGDRLRVITARFMLMFGAIGAFALGSLGPVLALHWDPVVRHIMLIALLAFLTIRLVSVAGTVALAPQHEHLRVIPMRSANARFWRHRLTRLTSWFAISWVIAEECAVLGMSSEGIQVIVYGLGLGTVAIGLAAVWHGPIGLADSPQLIDEVDHRRHIGRAAERAAISLGIVLLWVFWVAAPGITGVRPSFWLVLDMMALPIGIRLSRSAVEHVLRPATAESGGGAPAIVKVSLEHGIRALLIIAAAGLLAWGWNIDLFGAEGPETVFSQVVHGALSTVVILLLADVFWNIMKAAIDGKLEGTADPGDANSDEAKQRARLHTLLPIFRNVLFVFIIAVAVMMVLAGFGVQIGPLLAGASVVGVAIGFGAQTFVRDVIAGMFYLLDDAFRVGEYIQSGNYKGTVEGFSIRSVRLRHHRGPVYTVPFSLLGAIQNQSRDWVIDKLTIGITYDSDIEKARKLIKQIGLELAEVPEFKPLIIEPLKMQGVEQFDDYAVKIRMKMMTLPGEQFVIRRKAYAMIKKAFDENGIKFAFPTVQVAGDSEGAAPAVARKALELTQPAPAAAAE